MIRKLTLVCFPLFLKDVGSLDPCKRASSSIPDCDAGEWYCEVARKVQVPPDEEAKYEELDTTQQSSNAYTDEGSRATIFKKMRPFLILRDENDEDDDDDNFQIVIRLFTDRKNKQ